MKTIKTKNLTWIDIHNTTEQDIKYLRKNFNFHNLILKELMPPSQRSRVEQFDDQLYLVLYFPVFHKETRQTKLRELDIIIGKNILITSHYKSILPLKALFNQCNLYEEQKEKHMSRGAGLLLYYIINNLLDACLPKLDNITKNINKIEDKIFQGHERKMVTELSVVKRDILNMAKAIKPQKPLLESLNLVAPKFFGENYKIYFQDLMGSYEHVRSVLDNQQEVMNSLQATNESLLSNKISDTMKMLTVVSFIFLPLVVVASVFGMNIKNPAVFAGVVLAMCLAAGLIFAFARKKKWL